MKTLSAILKEQDCIVHGDGNIFITSEAKLEKVINEVISQRAGEPVAEICKSSNGNIRWKDGLVLGDMINGKKLFLAADQSVIDYVKTLRAELDKIARFGSPHDGYGNSHGNDLAVSALNQPIPNSIKHLLT